MVSESPLITYNNLGTDEIGPGVATIRQILHGDGEWVLGQSKLEFREARDANRLSIVQYCPCKFGMVRCTGM
eukprot:scaffold121482_cov23-Cyclotella_meneghiniana.AAC.1